MEKIFRFIVVLLFVVAILAVSKPARADDLYSASDLGTSEVRAKLVSDYLKKDKDIFKGVNRIAIAEFTVSFLYESEVGDLMSVISQSLKFDDKAYSAIAESLYPSLEATFKAAGFDVVSREVVLNDPNFKALVSKPSETYQIFSQAWGKRKSLIFHMVPAAGFGVTGGGAGLMGAGIAANAMAQIGNLTKYPQITRDVSADATVAIDVMVSINKDKRLVLHPTYGGIKFIAAYIGVNDDGHGNVSAADKKEINICKEFTLSDIQPYSGEITADKYSQDIDLLLTGFLGAVLPSLK